MTTINDPLKTIFLAGVGALSIGAEKSQELLETLVAQGELSVEQGRQIATELQSSASEKTEQLRDEIIRAQMKTMTKDERDAFAARIAEIAASVDGDEELIAEEDVEISA